jgi:hypothetical protein
MAKSSNTTPAPTPGENQVEVWTPPSGDEEFEFTTIQDAPGWVDRGWASFDRGPALAVPAGDLYGEGPYHTTFAHVGDKVVYTAPRGATPAKLSVIAREPGPENAARKPPQQTSASLEDMLKNGFITPDDLGAEGKAQVASRSPRLGRLLEGEGHLPEGDLKVGDVVKLDD